jgi:anti-anti-sigma factor
VSAIETVPTVHGVVLLRPGRRLNMVSAPQLTAVVSGLVAEGRSRVVVDLSETEFVDSSGLGALVSCLKKLRQAGGDLKLSGALEQVTMVLDLTNLSRVLRPRPTVADAVADFG